MKVIIVGYGRLGRGIAQMLEHKGNDITVIDNRPEVFNLPGDNFRGKTILGVGFDKDVLEQAGISRVDAVVSCTRQDETNALIARIARHQYRVPRAIARLYDPRKASLYNALGIQTISPTSWAIRYATELLDYKQFNCIFDIADSQVEIIRIELPALLDGYPVNYLNRPGESQVVAMKRGNKALVPTDGSIMQAKDIIFVSLAHSAFAVFKELLGL